MIMYFFCFMLIINLITSSEDFKSLIKDPTNNKEDQLNALSKISEQYKINEKKVELGDLVCYARQDGVTYDTTGSYNSHCDLVVEIDGDNAYAIGGNVSNSVTKSTIPLTSDGYAKAGNRRFVVIKTK